MLKRSSINLYAGIRAGLLCVVTVLCMPAAMAQEGAPANSFATRCEALISATTYDYAIISAHVVANKGKPYCRAEGLISGRIRFAVNLPEQWNQRLLMLGGGGWDGFPPNDPIMLPSQEWGASQGYATVFTDGGHNRYVTRGASFALNNLEAEVDFGFRAVHLGAVTAKTLIALHYGKAPDHSYFTGCSTGGRQAILSAQRFPDDFDGIVAGAPVHDFTGLMYSLRQVAEALQEIQITPARLQILADAVYEQCDGIDGLVDRVIEDPRSCDFDAAKQLPICPNDVAADNCFTTPQAQALNRLYGPAVVNGKRVHPGIVLGAEIQSCDSTSLTGTRCATGWEPRLMNLEGINLFGQEIPAGRPMMEQRILDWVRYVGFELDDPERDWKDFDPATQWDQLALTRGIHDATNANLSRFADHGGKILIYHGWSDTGANPARTAEYVEDVYRVMGPRGRDTARLFMVPGMYHCGGGTNVDQFDKLTPLLSWVEKGEVPDQVVAARVENGQTTRTRLICAFPETARFKGKGSTDEAESFECVAPSAQTVSSK